MILLMTSSLTLVVYIHPRNTNRLKFGNDTTAQFDEKIAVPPAVAAEKIWESIREPPTYKFWTPVHFWPSESISYQLKCCIF